MRPNPFDLAGHVVLVSGGSRGIGLALAQAFTAQRAQVVITGRDAAALAEACADTDPAPHPMTFETCDVADTQAIEACVGAVVAHHGRIDALINCAGVNTRLPAEHYTPDVFDRIMQINLRGTFFMSQAVGKQMIRQKSGCQINIDSLSSHTSLAGVAPYGMSKAALSNMTRTLAVEWGRHGVRVNALAPGFILTDLTEDLWSDPNLRAWNQTVTPLRRMGTVDDLTGTALFLASPAAGFLTGQVIRVDGGVSAGLNWPVTGGFEVKLPD